MTNNVVTMGGVRLTVAAAAVNSLDVVIPPFAKSGNISVTSNGRTAISAQVFYITFSGVDTSFIPVSFAQKAKYTTGLGYPYGGPVLIRTADFDGDGRSDMLVGDNSGFPANLSIQRNLSTNGQVNFGENYSLSLFGSANAVAVADIDNDGKQDLSVVVAQGTYIWVYRNTSTVGSISFGDPVLIPCLADPNDILAGDLDGDGRLDLVTTSSSGDAIGVHRNTSSQGNISFNARQDFVVGRRPQSLAIADFNMDGKSDIAIANTDANKVTIMKNTSIAGNISLFLPADIAVGPSPAYLAVADYDADGKPDIALTLYGNKGFCVLRNTSDVFTYSFEKNIFSDTNGPRNLIQADADGDGVPDLILTNSEKDVLSVYKNISTPGHIDWRGPGLYQVEKYGFPLATGDANGNGKPDIFVGNSLTSSVVVMQNETEKPYIASFSPDTSFNGRQMTIRGGNLSTASTVTVAGIPVNTFTVHSQSEITVEIPATGSGAVAVTTEFGSASKSGFTFLGVPQLFGFSPASGNAGIGITIYGKNFIGVRSVTVGGIPAASFRVEDATTIVAVAGSGQDGSVKVETVVDSVSKPGFSFITAPVITNVSDRQGFIGSTLKISGHHFLPSSHPPYVWFGHVQATPSSVTDSTIFVSVPAGASSGPVQLTSNYLAAISNTDFSVRFPGAGATFTEKSFSRKGIYPVSFAFLGGLYPSDYNRDGLPDLAFNDGLGGVKSITSTSIPGKIQFAPSFQNGSFYSYYTMTTADADNDGFTDLITGRSSGHGLAVLRNLGATGSQSAFAHMDMTDLSGITGSAAMIAAASADFDGDGRIDLVASYNQFPYTTVVYRNISSPGSMVYEAAIFIDPNNTATRFAIGDLDGDGRCEIIANKIGTNGIKVYKNNSQPGKILFDNGLDVFTQQPVLAAVVFDADQDGKKDIVAASYPLFDQAAGKIIMLKNTSVNNSLSFGSMDVVAMPGSPQRMAAADFDGDGLIDLAGCNFLGKQVWVLKNTSSVNSPSFASPVFFPTLRNPDILTIADFDADGKPDIAYGGQDTDSIFVIRNKVGEATIVPSGANPVVGELYSRVTLDSVVKTNNNVPYVQRHYDMEPEANAANATATVTLYFSQSDFDNYNAYPGAHQRLPAAPSDEAGKAALRIYQFHGFSATGLPGSYPGTGTEIDPDDNLIIWNPVTQFWEVTFDVVGFSGFFAGASGSSLLPVQLISFSAVPDGNSKALLKWSTSVESGVDYFEVERGSNPDHLTAIGRVKAAGIPIGHNYQFTDAAPLQGTNYYQLRVADKDGSVKFTKIVSVALVASRQQQVFPNPTRGKIFVAHGKSTVRMQIIDATGKLVGTYAPLPELERSELQLAGLPPGVYTILISGRNGISSEKFILLP